MPTEREIQKGMQYVGSKVRHGLAGYDFNSRMDASQTLFDQEMREGLDKEADYGNAQWAMEEYAIDQMNAAEDAQYMDAK